MRSLMHTLIFLVLAAGAARGAFVSSEFIFEQAPFPSCNALSIVGKKEGLVAAWFG